MGADSGVLFSWFLLVNYKMKIYKFKDTIDGNHAFILAQSESEAWAELNKITALKCRLVDTRNPEDLKKPVVILNHILPF